MAERWKTKDLLDWIQNNAQDIGDAKSVLEAACWFVSVQEAMGIFEVRLKDIASMIRDGAIMAGPYQTEEHLEEWLSIWYGDEDEPTAEQIEGSTDSLIASLERYFQ